MENCIFCKILKGEIPVTPVYEDAYALAFNDINPQAPTHLLVIHREHYAGLHDIPPERSDILAQIFSAVSNTVTTCGLTQEGYRLIINSGKNSGQDIPHIHVHILAGRRLRWPPG